VHEFTRAGNAAKNNAGLQPLLQLPRQKAYFRNLLGRAANALKTTCGQSHRRLTAAPFLPTLLVILPLSALSLSAQIPSQPQSLDRTLTTLHGVVRNAATGDGLPRALVRIEGDANTGALTDGEGRFEIPNIAVGPQAVEVRKPGFRNLAPAIGDAVQGDAGSSPHNVMVAAGMPDVVFTLAPDGAIRGQVELSTGDGAEGITVNLARRTIQQGRMVWQQMAATRTRSDGAYRFGLLAEGDYTVYSEPTLESDLDAALGGTGQRWGFASVYYPDTREPANVARIHVISGQDAQANLTLIREPFQVVSAAIIFPQGSSAERAGLNLSAAVLDSAGHQLPYLTRYDDEEHTVQAELPDGTYTLLVTCIPPQDHREGAGNLNAGVLAGSVEVTVAGHAVSNVHVVVSAPRPTPVQLAVHRNAAFAGPVGPVGVMVSAAQGWIDDGMVSEYAHGLPSGPLEAQFTRPGAYWVHTRNQPGLCEASFTAGGANLAREPVVMGLSGSTMPLELTMRDDCASLDLTLPDTMASVTVGEEPFFTVFAVPDFDSTSDIDSAVLRASTGGSMTLGGLTPGNYHVYTFVGAVQFAYKNREALARLKTPGQRVTLSPATTATLVVEVPAQ